MKKFPLLLTLVAGLLVSCGNEPLGDQQSQESSTTTQQSGGSGTHSGGETTGGEGTTGGGTSGGGTTTGGGGSETGGGTSGGGTGEQSSMTEGKDVSSFNLSNGQKPTSLKFNDEITLSLEKGTNNSNAPAYYTSDESLRFYPGNKLTVATSQGSISHILLRFSAGENITFVSNVGSLTSNATTWNGSSSSITFTVDGSSGNIRLYSLTITYSVSGGTTTGGGTSGGGTETGGGSETGGGTTGGGGGTVTPTHGSYTSTWPTQYQKYVDTYLNGMLPCFLNVNKKCLFNGFATKCVEGSQIPYFNPYVKNTSPGINYEYDYGGILRDAGFTYDGTEEDEDGDTHYYYHKGLCYVKYSKYRADDNIYYFDVYAYYDYYCTEKFPNEYNFQYDSKDLSLANKYESNNKTVKVKNWNITLNDVMKNGYNIQLKKDTGSIKIEGNLKGLFIEATSNADALFVKAGTSSSTTKYMFNNGCYFEFPSGTKYAEISAQSRVITFEFFDIIY